MLYDLHAHSTHSDGQASVDYIIEKAREGGYRTGISDHLYCDGIFTDEDIVRYLDDVTGRGIPVGGEANIGEEFMLPDRLLKRFDYLIASVHAVFPPEGKFAFNKYFAMKGGFIEHWAGYDESRALEYLELSVRHIESHFSRYRTDILGHATMMPFYDDLPQDSPELIDWEKTVVSLCKKYGVAMEISSMWKRPHERMLRVANEADLIFSHGSDCHRLDEVGVLDYSLDMVARLSIPQERIFVPVYEQA